MIKIRKARLEDLEGITDIYNDAVLKTTATFDTEPKTIDEQKRWFRRHGSKYPLLVAENERLIIGWSSLSPWSDRCAYSDTAEISVYVKREYRGKGIGKRLIEAVLREGKMLVFTRLLPEFQKAMMQVFTCLRLLDSAI